MEPAQVAMLQNLLRQESRSLLQYAAESFPWAKAEDEPACDAVRAMAQAESDALGKIARWLAKQRVPLTFPGAYPLHFTTINFIAVHALVPRLIHDQLQRIAAVEMTAATVTDADGQALVQALLNLKKQHLTKLTGLSQSASPPALAS